MIFNFNLLTKINFLILLIFPVFFILGKSFVNLGVILLTFSCIIFFLCNKINPFSKTENIFFGIFFIYIFINSLINYSEFNNTLKSIALFRYIFFLVKFLNFYFLPLSELKLYQF